MPTFIVGVERYSHTLMNAIAHYCQATKVAVTPERTKAIYHEVWSQLVQKLDPDAQLFMINLMELPVWATIYYTDQPMNYEDVQFFADTVHATGLQLWQEMTSKGILVANHFYLLESCDTTVLIIRDYIDSGQS